MEASEELGAEMGAGGATAIMIGTANMAAPTNRESMEASIAETPAIQILTPQLPGIIIMDITMITPILTADNTTMAIIL